MYKRIILRDYKPALTKGVKEINLDLNYKVNVIIGRNGVGKTSLLRECNVFPAESKNFGKNGYKYVERVYNGKLFTLTSYVGSKTSHSFKIDNGPELNPNGTQTVQKELIEKYLNITPKMQSYLNNLDTDMRFSFLSPSQRKELLMDIYPHDTNYAMGVFKKLTTGYRDNVGALRNLTKRLAEEKERYKKLQELNNEELLSKISAIDGRLKEALVLQGSLNNAVFDDMEFNTLYRKFVRLTEELTLFQTNEYKYSIPVLEVLIKENEGVIDYKKGIIKRLNERIEEITNSLNGFTLKDQNPETISSKIELLERELLGINDKQKEYTTILNSFPVFKDELLEHLIPITKEFISYLNAVVPKADNSITSANEYKLLVNRVNEDANKIRATINQMEELKHTLDHFNGLSEVTCEKCSHSFKPGVSAEQIKSTELRLNKLKTDLLILQDRNKKDNEVIEANADWYSTMLALTNFVKENRTVKNLLQLLQVYKVGNGETNTNNLINALKTNYKLVKLNNKANTLTEELNLLKARLALLKDNDMLALINEFNSAEQYLGECNAQIINLTKDKEELVKQLDELKGYNLKVSLLDNYRNQLVTMLVDKGKVGLRNSVEKLIAQLSPEKDRLVADLIRSKSTFTVITSIEENIEQLKKRNNALKKLIDGLCPNKGLIGKLMSDFIVSICGNVNSVIREVWVSPLYVKPCSKENGELNYQFPVINSYDNSANHDVSKCSGGEREIIDWAMQITLNKYSKAALPITMDEVGNMMDEVHRPRFFNYVKNYCNSPDNEQLLMISHYVHQYGLLENANIVKLEAAK